MEEIWATAAAQGVSLPSDAVDGALALVDSLPPQGTASLHRDLEEGRRSELDAWTGAAVRIGRESGVPTPVHSFIYSVLLPTELQARGPTGVASS